MKRALVAILLALLSCAASNASDKRRPAAADLVGNWEGTSICQVKPSPCHDEHVIFRLSHPQRDKINVQADKIVDSKPVTMGVDDWRYDDDSHALIYELPRGTWRLLVNENDMSGTLVTTGNIVFRKVHLHRVR